MKTRLIVALSLSSLWSSAFAVAALAAPKTEDPKFGQLGGPGWYASVCGVLVTGDTEREAIDSCQKSIRKERWLSKKKCDCKKRGDVVHLDAKSQPVFWVAGYMWKGPTAKGATAACEAAFRDEKARTKKEKLADWHCDKVAAVFGPYKRKPYEDDMDNSKIYNYFSVEGVWVDRDGNSPCFPAGTMVTLADGTTKPIEGVAVGEEVLSWSTDEQRLVAARVVRVKPRVTNELLVLRLADGRALRVTANHPLMSPSLGTWVPAGELTTHDTVDVLTGDAIEAIGITAIEPDAEPQSGAPTPVWDLTIDPTHDFFADGVLAHNY